MSEAILTSDYAGDAEDEIRQREIAAADIDDELSSIGITS